MNSTLLLNESEDFTHFYKVLEATAPHIRQLILPILKVDKLRSNY